MVRKCQKKFLSTVWEQDDVHSSLPNTKMNLCYRKNHTPLKVLLPDFEV